MTQSQQIKNEGATLSIATRSLTMVHCGVEFIIPDCIHVGAVDEPSIILLFNMIYISYIFMDEIQHSIQ